MGRERDRNRRLRTRWYSSGPGTGAFSLGDFFASRIPGASIRDARVQRAAHPFHHAAVSLPPRQRGPREAVLFNACVVATVELIRELQATPRIDWCAATVALAFYGWGPWEYGTPFGAASQELGVDFDLRVQRAGADLDALRRRVHRAYWRTTRRAAARNKKSFKRIKDSRKS